MAQKLLGMIVETAAKSLILLALAAVMSAGADPETTVNLELEKGELVGGSDTFRFREGEHIDILWTSDEPVELHLHGYDLTVSASPEAPGELRFTGSITGRFPVTSHGSADGGPGGHRVLIYIEIHPE
jgi:hypothetical protein